MSDAARLLEVLRDAALRRDDLAAALRACALPGTEQAAQALAAGETLPRAIAGLVPPRTAALLAGGLPPLATVAALLADEAWRVAERRRMVADHLGYPIAALVLVSSIGVILRIYLPATPWYGSLASPAWALLPAFLALLVMAAPWAPRSWGLPGSGWARHLDLAGLWARAALAVQWRLTEEQAQRLLGADLVPLAAVLGAPDAQSYCRQLAEWHRATAQRRLAVTAYLAAALVLLVGGALVLGSIRMWTSAPT